MDTDPVTEPFWTQPKFKEKSGGSQKNEAAQSFDTVTDWDENRFHS